MTKLPTDDTIAGDLDAQADSLSGRCSEAKGKDADDVAVMVALIAGAQAASRP